MPTTRPQVLSWPEHLDRWHTAWYRKRIRQVAGFMKSNGCTGVPDWHVDCCFEHDIAYRSGHDVLGYKITRREADKRLRWCIQMESPFGIFSPMSWWRWLAVRLFGFKAWVGMVVMMLLMGCSVPLTPEILEALSKDNASLCVIAKIQGGAGAVVVTPLPIPSGGYGSADLVICRTNEPGSKIILDDKGIMTIEHGK